MLPEGRHFRFALAAALGLAVAGSPALGEVDADDANSASEWRAVPASIDDALQRLEAILPAQETEEIRAGKTSPPWWDRTVGPQLLEYWVNPPDSPLTRYFRNLGIDHPQDISGILRHFYYLYLNHRLRPMDLERTIRARQRYWARLLTPERIAAAEALSNAAGLNPALLQSAYDRNATLVGNDFDGSTLSAPAIPLMVEERQLRDRWILEQLSGRASRDAGIYQDVLAELDPNLHIVTLKLGTETTLISTNENAIGQVLIAVGGPGRPPELWRMDMHVPEDGPYAEQLRCWQALARIRPCAAVHIDALSPDAQARPRFYIDAEYAQPAGATRGRQLSVWRWDGRTAIPLYVASYTIGGDAENQGVTAEGEVLRIGGKGFYQALSPCGACDGRETVQRLELTASDRIEDLGTTSLTPELDLIDTLYTRVKNRRPTGNLASPEALTVIEETWNELLRRGRAFLFMNEPQDVSGAPGRRELCFLAYYGAGGSAVPPILFTFSGSGAELRVVGARENADAKDRSCAAGAGT